MKKIDVLYENDSCIIFNKPAGLAVQGGSGVNVSLDSIISCKFTPRPLLVHRLDKDTSGVILTAKNKEAAAFFSKLFLSGLVKKNYLAICATKDDSTHGTIKSDLLIKDVVKKAVTYYTIREQRNNFALVEIELGTGRMHQIRRHLASIKKPIVGDAKYGDFNLNKNIYKEYRFKQLMLHSSSLSIQGPDKKMIEVIAPIPDCFKFFYNL